MTISNDTPMYFPARIFGRRACLVLRRPVVIFIVVLLLFVSVFLHPRSKRNIRAWLDSKNAVSISCGRKAASATLAPAILKPQSTSCSVYYSEATYHDEWQSPNISFTDLDIMNSGTFKLMANVVYGDPYMSRPSFITCFTELSLSLIPCLQPGVVIQVNIIDMDVFSWKFLPHIQVPFVLMSVDSDDSSPGAFKWIINSPHLIHWFGQNCDVSDEDPSLKGKFTCIPIGMSQWHDRPVYMHNSLTRLGVYNDASHPLRQGRLTRRENLLLVSFATITNPRERKAALKAAKVGVPAATVRYVTGEREEDFYKVMSTHQFVLSPHGAGLDCHRTWEALHLGCIPVVKTSTLDSLYEGLPVLILKDWSELTTERLERAWSEFSGRTFDLSPLYVGYWERMIYAKQQEYAVSSTLPNSSYLRQEYAL